MVEAITLSYVGVNWINILVKIPEVKEAFRSFTQVKVPIPQCTVPLHYK